LKTLYRLLIFPVRVLLAVAIGMGVLFYALQRQMMYYPMQAEESRLLPMAEEVGLQPWKTADGAIIGWKTPVRPEAVNRLLIFHGNAGFALHRHSLIELLSATAAGKTFQFFILEYPGYGAREGSPSEENFVAAALEAAEQLNQDLNGKLLLLGESIGSGVACGVASQLSPAPAGLLLLTPFDSMASVASHHYPWLPVSLILKDRYESRLALESYKGRLVVVLAENDRVVPAVFGQRLFDSYEGSKRLWEVAASGHNDLLGQLDRRQWQEMLQFLLAN